MIRELILLLLTLFPHMSHGNRPCIERRVDVITEQAREASRMHNVPPHLLISVGFHESHLGCQETDWGAPASRTRRHTPGTPVDAARALANGYAACRSWEGAVFRFRSGLCRSRDPNVMQYVTSVMNLSRRLEVYAIRASRAEP